MLPDPKWDWTRIILFSLLSLIGGSLGYTMRTLDKNEKVSFWRAMLEGLCAAFFGVITGIICMENHLSIGYSSAIIGLMSWIGARASFIIVRSIAYRRLGLPEEKKDGSDTGN